MNGDPSDAVDRRPWILGYEDMKPTRPFPQVDSVVLQGV